jgi:hypothetical protein
MMLYILINKLSERIGGKAATNNKVHKNRRRKLNTAITGAQSRILNSDSEEKQQIAEEKAEQDSEELAKYSRKKKSIPLHTRLVARFLDSNYYSYQ